MASTLTMGVLERVRPHRKLLGGCGAGLLLLIVAGLAVLNAYWPYRYRMVEPTLEKVFASKIKMDHYHRTYFPYPGFVADGLTLRRNSAPDLPPVGSVKRVRVEGSWLDLLMLRRRIATVYADGLQVVIPPAGSQANREDFPAGSSSDFEGPDTAVERLVMKDAELVILKVDGGRYSFPIKRLVITDLQKNKEIGYSVEMGTPLGGGRLTAQGSFGPLVGGKLAQTPAQGTFRFDGAKLDGISDIHGILSSAGSFRGTLAAIAVDAKSKVVGFSVGYGQPVPLTSTEQAVVSGLSADIQFRSVDVVLGKTTVHGVGQIAGRPKVTDLDVTVEQGMAQDLMRPLMRANPPLVGPVRLHTHAHVAADAPGDTFLDRLVLTGAFEIPREQLTNVPTAKALTAFSERAQGVPGDQAAADAEEHDVVSSLAGAVSVSKGVARASKLVFVMPGASVEANGTFNLKNESVDMQGVLRMQADISHVTTGFKSFLLKPLAPFFRKEDAGAVVPVKLTGAPGSYKVGPNF